MEDGFWFSAILGSGIGGIYILLVFLSLRLAARQSKHSFITVILGGMAIRLFLAVAAIAIIIALVPIDKVIFLTAFLGVFLIGLTIEVVIFHRQQGSPESRKTSE
ncbi:MAG: hypothetical protein BMS9Abin05_1797 [Rhodothermia bacterium]|nr:MAG: hypothetical protein BMS9Abin05_1797 [Rhodothermia bacterium]